MSLTTVSYVFSVAFLFQLLLVGHLVFHRILSDCLAVCGILSSSQAESPHFVPPTTFGNVHTSDGFCGSNCDMGRQRRSRVSFILSLALFYLSTTRAQPHLPWCFYSVFRSGFHRIVRYKCSADHSGSRSSILRGYSAFTMGNISEMETPVGIVV